MAGKFMKKITNLFMVICLILGSIQIKAEAFEVCTKYLQICVNGNIKTYQCLWDSEEIYCTIENLAEMSNYRWAQIEDTDEFEFFREYDEEGYGIELQTNVLVKIDREKKIAQIGAMNKNYTMNCYIENNEIFLPFTKLLYCLHAKWMVEGDIVNVRPMPLTILDFMAIRSTDYTKLESSSRDALINTSWWFSSNKWGQAVHSSLVDLSNDFDGKIFLLWWPKTGHVQTAEYYESAILQLVQKDQEFLSSTMLNDAMKLAEKSLFFSNNDDADKIENIMFVPLDKQKSIKNFSDAVVVLKELIDETLEDTKEEGNRIKNIAWLIENGEDIWQYLEMPQLESKAKELGEIGDGLAILQCVWNVYDTMNRINEWDEEFLEELQLLADYENPGYVSKNVAYYVQSSAKRLLDSYQDPTEAMSDEALQSTMGLLFEKLFDATTPGKIFSIMSGIGAFCGRFDVDINAIKGYGVYSELSTVTFSIKIEQLVRALFRYDDLLTTTNTLTMESIKKARNQLMLYLRLNVRNKVQIYNLNIKGNKTPNWIETKEAKELYQEILNGYVMLGELIETKDFDEDILLAENYSELTLVTSELKAAMKNISQESEKVDIEAEEDAYKIYRNAAENSISSGNWREEVQLTGDMNLVSSDQKEKVKTKATLEAACNVENYDEKNLSKLKISGDGKIQVAGQSLTWTVDYSDGVAHYQYTEPTSYTNDVAIDPVCFQFNVLTREMMQDASVTGDTISFTLSGDEMAQVTSDAMNMMSGIENLEFDNGTVEILINKEEEIISDINMTFHAFMEYMGYQADVDYDVKYQFIPSDGSKSSETEQVSAGKNGAWYGQFDESKVPEGAGEYNGHYYYAYNLDSITNWEDAKQYCEQMGGYLATVTSREEDEFLYSYLQNKFHYENAYFGFTDKAEEGKWKWSNGEESSYTNWHEGEPNAENSEEDFAMYYYKYPDGSWNDGDFDAGTVNGGTVFICEWGEYQTGSNVVEGSAEELYSSIITEYQQAFSDNVDYSYEELKEKYPYVNQSLVSLYFEGSKPFYGFYDVDGNGVDELFIGYETIEGYEYKIVDILTYETESGQIRNIGDGEVFSVNAGSFVYDTGVIYNIKADNIARFYRISSDGYHLELIKSYTLVKNQDNRFYFNDTEMLDGEEFDKMLREQGNQVPFEWSPLDEI